MIKSKPGRLKPKKDPDPSIVELHNDITGKTKWRVSKNGISLARGFSIPPWHRDFDTREEAVECYADNFGWSSVDKFQPTEEDKTEPPGF